MQHIIDKAWENKELLEDKTFRDELSLVVDEALKALDSGSLRVVTKEDNNYIVNQQLKKAILLSFRLNDNRLMESGEFNYFDKVPLKFESFSVEDFKKLGIRVVPGAVVRKYCFIGKGSIIMPSFVNMGAYIGEGTMVDTWATIGSCAQIGKNCHISGGAGIGGVLEPIQANPVIIEDNAFIGARSEVVEGVIVGEGAVLSMGVFIGASTRIYDKANDKVLYGFVPPYSVVVPGAMPSSDGKAMTYAAIIIKQVDSKTREKTSINQLLRE